MVQIKKAAFHVSPAVVFVLIYGVLAGTVSAFGEDVFEQVWFSTVQCDSLPDMEVSLLYPEKVEAKDAVPFTIELEANIPYEQVKITLDIKSDSQAPVFHIEKEMDIHSGRNQVAFEWCGSEIPCGKYSMSISVDYSDYVPPTLCQLALRKVSDSTWKSAVEKSESLLKSINEVLQKLPENVPNEKRRLQHRICTNAVAEAKTALSNAQWDKADHLVNYLQNTTSSLHAGIVFQGQDTGSEAVLSPLQLDNFEIRDGGFYSGGRPVFLFGAHLNREDGCANQVANLAGYGLNFAVETLSAGDPNDATASTLNAVVETAGMQAVAVAVQFDQNAIGSENMDAFPDLLEPGFVNLAHDAYAEVYKERLEEVAALLSDKLAAVAFSVADAPQFKFTGEAIRQQFIARIQERYPDRIELNRLWRSHLADYDEIVVWGDYPEHSYQNRRAFQFEWQAFQREKIDEFLAGLDGSLAIVAPNLPLLATLPNNAFTPAETRTGMNREHNGRFFDINGCAAESNADVPLYSLNYPSCQACYTLMRSQNPDTPILNMKSDIKISPDMSPESVFAFVRSTLWEAVISGANGMALSAGSDVFQYPEALEAYVTAAQDINRLAPVIVAFQRAVPEVGILFSEASKIMDDGGSHLESAQFAFEGATFAGYSLRFITEAQVIAGALGALNVLIIPDTLAVSDAAFDLLSKFVEDGGAVARVGKPIPYNERGVSRSDVIRSTANTILVRGLNLPTEYLHAMDAAQEKGVLPEIARPINVSGYPVEGIRSRYIVCNGEAYLYIINLRKEPVNCYLAGVYQKGYDLIGERNVAFPRELLPLEPMLIRMEKQNMG